MTSSWAEEGKPRNTMCGGVITEIAGLLNEEDYDDNMCIRELACERIPAQSTPLEAHTTLFGMQGRRYLC